VHIVNMLGQTVFNRYYSNSSSITISTSFLHKGVYMVSITGGNTVQTFRILTGE